MSKPTPGHKFRVGYTPSCECGWKGPTFFSAGARKAATWEWEAHVRHCGAVPK